MISALPSAYLETHTNNIKKLLLKEEDKGKKENRECKKQIKELERKNTLKTLTYKINSYLLEMEMDQREIV